MVRLPTRVNKTDESWRNRHKFNSELISELRDRINTAKKGGNERSVKVHRSRDKLLARERIDEICDPGSPFLELSTLAGNGMYDGKAQSAGIVTGIGLVNGRECMFVANDATVKGGSYYPMTVKKHIRAQEVAEANNLPCIYLVDSGEPSFPCRTRFSRQGTLRTNIQESSHSLKQGHPPNIRCLGILHSRWSIHTRNERRIDHCERKWNYFPCRAPARQSGNGEEVSSEELGGADLHTRESGVADHYAENELEALGMVREIVSHLNVDPKQRLDFKTVSPQCMIQRIF